MENARIAPVDVADIAKVAVALLQSDGTERKIYEMTGPEALTMSEVAERLSQALGETIRYVNVSPAAKREALLKAGVEPEFADAMDELFAERRRGIESRVLPETHKAFGVSPSFFLDFARRNAAVFRSETVAGLTQ
jgi:uncharacterized protein YbjT (DUF2867 family)